MTQPLSIDDIRGLVALLRTINHVDAARLVGDGLEVVANTRDLKLLAATLGQLTDTRTVPGAARGKAEREMKIRGILAELYGDLDREYVAQDLPPVDSTTAAREIFTGIGRYEAARFKRLEELGELPWMRPERSYHQLLQLHAHRSDTGRRTPSERSFRRKFDDLRAAGKIRR